MQLQEIKLILDRALPKLTTPRQETNRAGGTYWLYRNVNQLRGAINSINLTGLFPDLLQSITSSELYTVGGDDVFIDPSTGRSIEENISRLRTLAEEFSKSLTPLVGDPDEYTINIRLPFIQNFDDLSNASRDLQTILAQVVINEEVNGDVKILSVENGSIWFAVSLASAAAVALIGRIVKAALDIHTKILSNRILKGRAKVAKIDADRHEFLVDSEKKFVNIFLEIESESIRRDYFNNPDAEISERIKNSIKLLHLLMDKGVEIRPALNAPQQTKDIYPSQQLLNVVEEQKHILEVQKNITDGSESNIEKNSDVVS